MKKIITLILVLALVAALAVSFAACKGSDKGDAADFSKIKIGLICLHDNNSTYDKNFIDAFKAAAKELGIPDENVFIKTNIEESNDCYDAAVDLVDEGCDIIFADSFGHETFLMKAAREFPDVQFCHATGTQAHTAGVANFHNAFASIYEGRYLAGVVAGMKLNEMIAAGTITAEQAVMGYVGAYPYAEVKSGYTSFYLGAKSICPSVTMKVKFTNEWYHETKERETANALMGQGCVLISQHADSYGAPTACEEAGVPNVSYNGSTVDVCPNTFLVSSRINWAPYYKYAITCVVNGEKISDDYTGTIETGSVELSAFGTAVAAGTADKVAEVKAKLLSGETKVFATNTFTVDGVAKTSYLADVDDAGDYVGETEVIKNGAFEESKYRSAPYFDLDIDGITILE